MHMNNLWPILEVHTVEAYYSRSDRKDNMHKEEYLL